MEAETLESIIFPQRKRDVKAAVLTVVSVSRRKRTRGTLPSAYNGVVSRVSFPSEIRVTGYVSSVTVAASDRSSVTLGTQPGRESVGMGMRVGVGSFNVRR